MRGGGHRWSYVMLVDMPFSEGGSGAVWEGIGWGACNMVLCGVCQLLVIWGGLQQCVLAYPAPGFRGRGICRGLMKFSVINQWPLG